MRDNELRDSFANLLSDVCQDVQIEHHLQPSQGESFALKSMTTDDESRLDIKAKRFWESRFNETYFDVKIVNPLAKKTCPESCSEANKYHECIKKEQI